MIKINIKNIYLLESFFYGWCYDQSLRIAHIFKTIWDLRFQHGDGQMTQSFNRIRVPVESQIR